MKTLGFGIRALGIGAAVVLLAGCGGSQSGGAGMILKGVTALGHAAPGKSWMLPGTSFGDLLYVGSTSTNAVYVFTYPGGTQVGTLTGFNYLKGLCSDTHGNVWIANDFSQSDESAGEMVEYAHGGTSPIATLNDSAPPVACSVDPTTGNLATANGLYDGSVGPILGIYAHAQGTPTFYPYPSLFPPLNPDPVTYDNAGDVFIEGRTGTFGFARGVAWLPKGASTAEKIGLKPHHGPNDVFWDGTYLAVPEVHWEIHRYRIRKHSGKQVGPLINIIGWHGQFWIQGSTFIGATGSAVSFWNYPAGGSPFQTINVAGAYGVTISVALSGSHIRP